MASTPLLQSNEASLVLSGLESSSAIQFQPGVTTVTFFRGQLQPAASFLRERLGQILSLNPWVVGRVVRNKEAKNVQLVYPSCPITDTILDELLRINPPNLTLTSKMSYADMSKAVSFSKALLPQASSLVNKSDLVTRITLVSDPSDTSAFAMVFSMSHTVADGYTYFSIMNMLSKDSNIKALNPTRNPEVEMRCEAAAKEDMAFLTSGTWMCGAISKLFFKPKNKYYAYLVDKSKVKKAKEEAVQRGAKFVSSNDIIVSTFGNMTKARLMFFAMNWRNRVEGASDADAGNYEATLWVDEGVYKYPEGLRKMLQTDMPFKGRTKPYPGVCEAMCSPMVGISNWASFAGGVHLPNCEHLLQMPMIDLSIVPIDMAIIFAPKANELAVIYGVKDVKDDESLCKQAPLGAKVADTLFP